MEKKPRVSLASQASRLGRPREGQAQKRWLDRVLTTLVRFALGRSTEMDRARLLAALALLEHIERTESNSDPKEEETWQDDDSTSPDEPFEEG